MDRPESLKVIRKSKTSLTSLPAELHLAVIHYLPRTSLPTICRLNSHWRRVGTDELLQRLLPIPHHDDVIPPGADQLMRPIRHFIDTNNADALQRLLDFRPKHPYLSPAAVSLLRAEPVSLRARVTKDQEERYFLDRCSPISSLAVNAAFRFNDMACMQRLIDHEFADYRWPINMAVYDGFCHGVCYGGWLARPCPGADSRDGHNSVLDWLLAYPPRHVVQAMLVMCGEKIHHPRLLALCNWSNWHSPDSSRCDDNMLVLATGRGHPASQQTIGELRRMVRILTDDASGSVIPEARLPLSRALLIARGMASMWPGTPSLVAEYLMSVCTWEDPHNWSSSSDGATNNLPPSPAPPLILPTTDVYLHRRIDLKKHYEMLEPGNWLELERVDRYDPLQWLVSTEFLADEDAARRMRCFEQSMLVLRSDPNYAYNVLLAAGAFRRWRCVEVMLGELRGRWPSAPQALECPDFLLRRAILDAVHGEPACADGRIIRKLLRTGARAVADFRGFGVDEDEPNDSPFRGGWFSWESFRLAFAEWQPDREKRETAACIGVRDAVVDSLLISDETALDFLVSEPSKALFRASIPRRQQRLDDKRRRVCVEAGLVVLAVVVWRWEFGVGERLMAG